MFGKRRYIRIEHAEVITVLGRYYLKLKIVGKGHWFTPKIHIPLTQHEYILLDLDTAHSLNLLPGNYSGLSTELKSEAMLYLKDKNIAISSHIAVFNEKKHSKLYQLKKDEERKKLLQERERKLAEMKARKAA